MFGDVVGFGLSLDFSMSTRSAPWILAGAEVALNKLGEPDYPDGALSVRRLAQVLVIAATMH